MADVYLRSGAAGGADGTTWADAYTTLAAAMSGITASDTIYVAHDHAENTSGSAITLNFPETPGLRILCTDDDSEPPTSVDTTAVVETSGSGGTDISFNGHAYIYGVIFKASTGSGGSTRQLKIAASSSYSHNMHFDQCELWQGAGSTASISVGLSSAGVAEDTRVKLDDCEFNLDASGQTIILGRGKVEISGMTLAGTAQTTVFSLGGEYVRDTTIYASDLSGTAWTNLFDVAGAGSGHVKVIQSKLRSGFTLATGSRVGPGSPIIELIDSDDGDEHYHYVWDGYTGTITMSNSIYADAGNGTDSFSWQMVSSANVALMTPLTSPAIQAFHDGTSAITTTIPIVYDNATNLQNDEIWQETLAKITTGSPKGTWNIGDRVADILTTPADQDADASTTWTGTSGFTNENKDKLVSGSFTPAEVGVLASVVKLAKPSTTVYVSPQAIAA